MLTIENDRKTIYEAIHIGADGYILKGSIRDRYYRGR